MSKIHFGSYVDLSIETVFDTKISNIKFNLQNNKIVALILHFNFTIDYLN